MCFDLYGRQVSWHSRSGYGCEIQTFEPINFVIKNTHRPQKMYNIFIYFLLDLKESLGLQITR